MHIALLLIFICVIYVIVIMGGIALQLTGLEKSRAKFQALSAFSGTGFTTRESETVVNHPRRRKIIVVLMILGNAGIVSLVATFAASLRKTGAVDISINLGIIAASIFLLYRIASHQSFATKLRRRLNRVVRRILHLEDIIVDEVLEQEDGYGVSRILMGSDSEISGKDLQHSELSKHDIMVLSIERDHGNIPFPHASTTINPGDRLICYGNLKNLRKFFLSVEKTKKENDEPQVQKKKKAR